MLDSTRHRTLPLALGLLPVLGACSGGSSGPAPTPAPELSVDAGDDQGSKTGRTVTLQAEAQNALGDLTYSWTQTGGPAVTLSDAAAAAPTFTAPPAVRGTPSTLSFRITVEDAEGRSSSDDIEILVTHAERVVFLSQANAVGVNELVLYDEGLDLARVISGETGVQWDVTSWEWSPDESALTFTRREGANRETYIVAPDGNDRVLLTTSQSDTELAWMPDSSAVVFLSDTDGSGPRELYSCPPDGSAATRLNAVPVANGNVSDFEIVPDGSRIVFRGDVDTDGQQELYSARADGSGLTKISRSLVAGGSVTTWTLSDDGAHVAYLADAETPGTVELYAVGSDGSAPAKLSAALVAGGNVASFAWAPNGSRVCYRADQDTDTREELYAVDADGTNAVKLSGPNPAGGSVSADFSWSSTGTHVAFRGTLAQATDTELFVALADGSGLTLLNGTMVANGDVRSFAWSPDASEIAYSADQDTDEVLEMYCVARDRSRLTKISPEMVAGGDVSTNSIQWAPDGSRVLFFADAHIDGRLECFSATPSGTADTLTPPLVVGNVVDAQWAPDSGGVALLGNFRSSLRELFHCAPDGSGLRILSPTAGTVIAEVLEFRWSPDSLTVAFIGNHQSYFSRDLFTVDLTTGEARPHTTNVYASDSSTLRWAPDSSDG